MSAPDEGLISLLALAAAVGFVCGVRPFVVAWLLGAAGALEWILLPSGLSMLQSTPVLVVCAGLAIAERMADALAWRGQDEDLLLSGLRVPMGAMLTAGLLLDAFGPWGWLGLPLGAALAGSGQALKAALRALLQILGARGLARLAPRVVDLALPLALAAAWWWPEAFLVALALVFLVAIPAAIWWLRELRSRWRQWAALEIGRFVP